MAPAKKATATTKARKPRTSNKPTSKWIRNLHNCVVHLRVGKHKDPEHINLEPRGTSGDIQVVDAQFINDGSFISGIGTMFEIITETEARDIQSRTPGRGFRPHGQVTLVRPEDTEIMVAPDWDGKGRDNPLQRERHSTAMNVTDLPGSDEGLHSQIRASEEAHAELDKPPRVVIERAKGQDNRASLGK